MRGMAAIAAGVLLLSGCSYPVVARLGPEGKIYRGTAHTDGFGNGKIQLASADGEKCFAPILANSKTGQAQVTCDDGQVGYVRFIITGLKTGYGIGQMSDGSPIRFYYGLSEKEGAQYLGPAQANAGRGKPPAGGTGSGFVISERGHILTNQHVVEGCKKVDARLSDGTTVEAEVLATDVLNDLAVVLGRANPPGIAQFRATPDYRQGDDVVAYGFPLTGALSSTGVLTTGTISSLAGLGDDSRFIQISAQIQAGNSGGPLADKSANIIGVNTQSLDDLKMLRATGSVPQNVNFAVKDVIAKTFLKTHRIPFNEAKPTTSLSNAEVGEKMRAYVVFITCRPPGGKTTS